ncbi:MAG: OadG family transporter subunit [Muribaculaceae bacterium]
MNKKGIILLLMCLTIGSVSFAQGRKGLRINEVMVKNDSNFVDDYGVKNAWIELYNTAFAPMEISSVYLTDDKNNPKKYPIPRGDVNTDIAPRQHVIFWADNEPERGTFHLNFKLKPGVDNWIGVYDSNGTTLIDEVLIPASLPSNATFARKVDGKGTGIEAWEIRDGSKAKYITPSSNNIIIATNIKKDKFKQHDQFGIGMAIMAMSVVFLGLIVLSISFTLIGKISAGAAKKNKLKAHGIEQEESVIEKNTVNGDSGEEIAAVCMALYEHLNAHDNEDTVLTISKVKRTYSPWSSKIYTLRELPRR